MKDMNTMKHLTKRIVGLYMNRVLMNENDAIKEFIQVCSQSEGVRAHKNLNEHGKFIARFCRWCSDVGDRPLVEIMSLMDDFFEKECGDKGYLWEQHIEYAKS
jgi:hypothetical protein